MMRRSLALVVQVDSRKAIERESVALGRAFPQVERTKCDVLNDGIAEKLVIGVLKN